MDDKVERAAVTQSDRGKVTPGARGDSTDVKSLEGHHRPVHQAQAEIPKALVHLHGV